MSEWGIPDWHDPESYGATSNWSFNRWRWEFLRRRADLRQEFDEKAPITHERDIQLFALERARGGSTTVFPFGRVLSPHEPGFYVCTEKLGGVHKLPNPRIGDQPDIVIEHYDGPEVLHFIVAADVPDNFERIDFDLSKPISPQLVAAKDLLLKSQAHRYGKLIQKRRHREKWLTYIRVLDAREAGATWAEIATMLPRTAGKETSARDTWEQARALCFNF